jgi:hypothetical protein
MAPATSRTPSHNRSVTGRRRPPPCLFFAILAAAACAVIVILVAGGGHRPARPRTAKAPSRSGSQKPPQSRPLPLLVREDRAIETLAGRYRYVVAGGPARREIALTFDDGPGPYTPALLDELARLHAPATFFEIGFMIGYFHDSLTRELALDDGVVADRAAGFDLQERLLKGMGERVVPELATLMHHENRWTKDVLVLEHPVFDQSGRADLG